MLSRLTPNIFLAFDGDQAGEKALSRAALVSLSLGLNPKVVPVPEGVDPAEFIKENGQDGWKKLLTLSIHFIQYKAGKIKKMNLSPHVLVRALKEEVFPYLSRVISPIEKNLYTESVAKELGIETDVVQKELNSFGEPKKLETIAHTETLEEFVPTNKIRFAAFAERYKSETTEKLKSELEKIKFGDTSYGPVEISSELRPQMLSLVERDYGMLNAEELTRVAKELQTKAREQFFSEINAVLTEELNTAEKAGKQEESDLVLKKLSELNRLRHE